MRLMDDVISPKVRLQGFSPTYFTAGLLGSARLIGLVPGDVCRQSNRNPTIFHAFWVRPRGMPG